MDKVYMYKSDLGTLGSLFEKIQSKILQTVILVCESPSH